MRAVISWLKEDWESRREHAETLLKKIRLGMIPVANLKKLVDAEIQTVPGCKEMLDEVEKCLAVKEASKTPMSVQYPHLFSSRGTVTVSNVVFIHCII